MVSAYNSNSVEARNILSSTPRDDILVEEMPCIARVEVSNAFFTNSYNGPKGVTPPVMRMIGTVASLFIEDDDDRVFPCNEKEIQLMSPESVNIVYLLSPEEISSMALKGMFHDPDFEPPANLIGNMIEIPLNITYMGIYDTPCCFVEVMSPLELQTSTQDNNYFGLFETCAQSEIVKQHGVSVALEADTLLQREPRFSYQSTIEDYQQEEPEQEETQEQLTDEEQEDRDIQDRVGQMVGEASADMAERRSRVDMDAAKATVDSAREGYRQQKAEEALHEDNDYKLYGGVEQRHTGVPVVKVGPEEGRSTSSIYDILRTRTAEEPDKPEKYTGFSDEAGNQERQYGEGYEETEGQEDDGFVDYDDQGEGSLDDGAGGKSAEARRKAAAAKQQLINRQVDRAQDLKAMNAGITDTAGFGAAEAPAQKKPAPVGGAAMAQRMLAEIRAKRQAQANAVQQQVVSETPNPDEKQAGQGGQFL